MKIRYINDADGLREVRDALAGASRIALDSEAAGYHRYSDRVCLLQLTADATTFLIDPLAADPGDALRGTIEDPAVETLMHGADYDIRLLGRDLGIGVAGVFDTQIAAALLGLTTLGLAGLLEAKLGVRLSKKYQKADWAQRPLTEPMLEYAAHDTIHLAELADLLKADLLAKGRLAWAEEEFREIEKVRFEEAPADQDPVSRIKAARTLEPRQVARLREALRWRDEIAKDLDRAHFRVAGDQVLIEAARLSPSSVEELEAIPGMGRNLARQRGEVLIERFRAIDALPDKEVVGWPRPPRNRENGSWVKKTPEIEARFQRLKEARNARATALEIDKGVLLSNAVLQMISERPPRDTTELADMPGMRKWQVEVVGADLLKVL